LTSSHITTTRGWFNRICQVVTMCNTCFLRLTQVIPKWHLDRFSHFCTAHGRESHTLQWATPSPSKLPLCKCNLDSI